MCKVFLVSPYFTINLSEERSIVYNHFDDIQILFTKKQLFLGILFCYRENITNCNQWFVL